MKTLEQKIRARKHRNDLLLALGTTIFLVGFAWAIAQGLQGNREYSEHVCSDIYGLDKNCND